MAQEFFINKNSTLPIIKMEVVNNGRYDFNKFYELIQNAKIYFSMVNYENGTPKILNNESNVFLIPKENCADEYYVCYRWSDRDVNTKGKFKAYFTIIFNENNSKLITPIEEELIIYIQ